jgi:hypothetical protein
LIAVPSIGETEIAGIREEAVFRTKISTKGKWSILKCIAFSTKIFFCIANVLAGSSIKYNYLRLQKKACRKQKAWRKKRKCLHFFGSAPFLLSSSLFSCSKTTVTATRKPWGLACSAACIKLFQAAFRLLYLSDISEEEEEQILIKHGI